MLHFLFDPIFHQPRVSVRFLRALTIGLLLMFALTTSAPGQTSPRVMDAPITLAVFSDKPLSEQLWPMLATALREELAAGAPELDAIGATKATATIHILRGDTIRPGIVVDKSITVFIHGECIVTPIRNTLAGGQKSGPNVLGWVETDHGKIAPFIHVECTHIGELLGMQRIGGKADARSQQMATAMARVILHEWIHIATQKAHHARQGVFKAQFGVADLEARGGHPPNRPEEPVRNSD